MEFLRYISLAFFAILFIQSGADKIFQFQANKSYINSVFSKTFLKNLTSPLFYVLLVLEVTAGILCLLGMLFLFIEKDNFYALLGLNTAAVALLCLFAGQRIAQDYAGAAGIVPYFFLCITCIILLFF
jgi:putative oxidoreductase